MNILIASPDPLLTALICRGLHSKEHRVQTCHDEHRFCDMYRSGDFEVVVTMFAHPFINGGDLATTTHNTNTKPVTFVLSWQQSEQVVMALYESGIDQYMTLPVSIDRLTAKIRKVTAKK